MQLNMQTKWSKLAKKGKKKNSFYAKIFVIFIISAWYRRGVFWIFFGNVVVNVEKILTFS